MDGADVSGHPLGIAADAAKKVSDLLARPKAESAGRGRMCNCQMVNEWHTHGTRSCPPEPPVQEYCSPSLTFTGQCRCPQHLQWERDPASRPKPPPPLNGPLELDDAVGAFHHDGCETCDERRRTGDYPDWAWGPLGPFDGSSSEWRQMREHDDA